MKAALIHSSDQPPHYADVAEPAPPGPGQLLVEVLAAGLHHLTRGHAAGTHYAGGARLPAIAGVDGVGRGADGSLHYFVQGAGLPGTMAERTVIAPDRSVALPGDADPVTVAAAMNPAMAAWLALRCRVSFQPGQKLLVLGATGSAGRMAVQIGRLLGASDIVATGRDQRKLAALAALGATHTVALGDARIGSFAAEADVVLDFVWGGVAMGVLRQLLEQRSERSGPLSWIHVGSMAGDDAVIPGALLRRAPVQILGSGMGSVPARRIVAELPALAGHIARGDLRIDARAVPLSQVEQAWNDSGHADARLVITP